MHGSKKTLVNLFTLKHVRGKAAQTVTPIQMRCPLAQGHCASLPPRSRCLSAQTHLTARGTSNGNYSCIKSSPAFGPHICQVAPDCPGISKQGLTAETPPSPSPHTHTTPSPSPIPNPSQSPDWSQCGSFACLAI